MKFGQLVEDTIPFLKTPFRLALPTRCLTTSETQLTTCFKILVDPGQLSIPWTFFDRVQVCRCRVQIRPYWGNTGTHRRCRWPRKVRVEKKKRILRSRNRAAVDLKIVFVNIMNLLFPHLPCLGRGVLLLSSPLLLVDGSQVPGSALMGGPGIPRIVLAWSASPPAGSESCDRMCAPTCFHLLL